METLSNFLRIAWADAGHYLNYGYAVARELWLIEVGEPGLLFGFRIGSFIAAIMAAATWRGLACAPIIERTWTGRELKVFRVLAHMVAVGVAAMACYFFLAGLFETQRVSSPVRLIFANVGQAFAYAALGLTGYFLRFLMTRKAVMVATQTAEYRMAAQERGRQTYEA